MAGLLEGARWYASQRSDPRAIALYRRHYSAKRSHRPGRTLHNFVGPGSPMVLLTTDGLAVFVWLENSVERFDKQEGICCTIFRNEGPHRSSDLIREACDLAWARWPAARLWTYVNPAEVRSPNPGYCFLKADFVRIPQRSTRGLLIFERLPAEGGNAP
jgi:hypothetical protein